MYTGIQILLLHNGIDGCTAPCLVAVEQCRISIEWDCLGEETMEAKSVFVDLGRGVSDTFGS